MADYPTFAPPAYMQMANAAGSNPLTDLVNRSQATDAKLQAFRQAMATHLQTMAQGSGFQPSDPAPPPAGSSASVYGNSNPRPSPGASEGGVDWGASPEYMNALVRSALGDHQAIAKFYGVNLGQ